MNTSGKPPAAGQPSPSGTGMSRRSCTTANSAWPPPATTAMTRSPGLKRVASRPAPATSPASSRPGHADTAEPRLGPQVGAHGLVAQPAQHAVDERDVERTDQLRLPARQRVERAVAQHEPAAVIAGRLVTELVEQVLGHGHGSLRAGPPQPPPLARLGAEVPAPFPGHAPGHFG